MALVVCPDCSGEVSDQAAACPRCGHPGPGAQAGTSSTPPGNARIAAGRRWSPLSKVIAAGVLLAVVCLGVYIVGLHDPKADAKAECKDEILTQVQDPDSATFVMRDSMKKDGAYGFIFAVSTIDEFGDETLVEYGCTVSDQDGVSVSVL